MRRTLDIARSLLLLALVAACASESPATSDRGETDAETSPAAAPLKIAATIPLRFSPAGVAVGSGAVWVSSSFSEQTTTVARIDPSSNAVTATIPLPSAPFSFTWAAFGEGSVWVSVGEGGPEPGAEGRLVVFRIDPGSNKVVATIPVGPAPTRPAPLAVGEGAVWVTNFEESTVTRIDPATNAVAETIRTTDNPRDEASGRPSGVAVTPGAVWVMNHRESTLLRIDPATSRIVASVRTQDGRVAAGEGSVWVASAGGSVVDRIDPETNRVVATIDECYGAHDIEVADGAVWVTQDTHSICLIDPASNKLVTSFSVASGGFAFGVRFGSGAAWVTAIDANALVRVEKTR